MTSRLGIGVFDGASRVETEPVYAAIDGAPTDSDSDGLDPGEPVSLLPDISIIDPDEDLGDVDSYLAEASSDIPIYMIGIDRTPTNRTGRGWSSHMGQAEVHIEEQTGPIILVLSARSPVVWQLTGPGVDEIERLVLLGLRDHGLVAEDLQVQPESPRARPPIPNEFLWLRPIHWWPAVDAECEPFDPHASSEDQQWNDRVCQARSTQRILRELLGGPIDAFAGTTVASEFVIHGTQPRTP